MNIEKSKVGVTLTDSEGILVYGNPSMERKTGFAIRQMIGKRPSQLWGGHMIRSYYDDLWGAMNAGKRFSATFYNQYRSGEKREDAMCLIPLEVDGAQFYMAVENAYGQKALAMPLEQLLEVEDVVLSVLPKQYAEVQASRKSDAQLLLQAKHSEELFGQLFEKYQPQVLQYFVRRISSRAVAEELCQDVFVKAFSCLQQYEVRNANYLTYLLRVAHNHLVNYYRGQRVHVSCDECDDIIDSSNMKVEQDKMDVHRHLSELSEIEQRIIRMKYVEGYKSKEIAVMIGKTENAVKLHLSRGRKKIKLLMTRNVV